METLGHILLTGYRGSGKSTIAKLLGEALNKPVWDTDQLIERQAGATIAEIFKRDGEAGFRKLETECLDSLSSLPPAIIALGGGAVVRPENRGLIQQLGQTFWLDATAETLIKRIAEDSGTAAHRPALTPLPQPLEVEHLLATRRPWYQEVANYRIDADGKTAEQITAEILAALHGS